MKAKIIKVGNSKGIRLPKSMIQEAQLGEEVDLKVEAGKIIISPSQAQIIDESVLLSFTSLAKEWDTPEEDKAWASLQ